MRKLIIATAAVAAFTVGSAGAADLPRKASPAPCQCSCDAAKFQGFHIGISGGGAKHVANRNDLDGFLTDNSGWVMEKWGWIGGGQFGYDWTTCHTVWGFEIDGSWGSVRNTLINNGDADEFVRTRLDAFVTARIRTGLVMDNLMMYFTGGVAAARFRTTWEDLNAGGSPLDVVTFSEWRWGWVAGFGTEWAWAGRWSFKSEVLYANFTDRDHSFVFPSFGQATFKHSDAVWITRIALNYRFGG